MLQPHRPLEVLFLVDFSDFAFRTIPFVAQLADALAIRLTLLHVRGPKEEMSVAKERLHSFFAEADRYPHCERLVASGNVHEIVDRRCASSPVDCLLMPASNPILLPRFGHSSARWRLLEDQKLPLWTIGPGTDVTRLGQPTKNVACWVDLTASQHPQIPYAVEYARKLDAQLHLLCAVPEITVTVALKDSIPLHPTAAAEMLLAEVGQSTRAPKVLVAEHDNAKWRRQLIHDCGADVIFVPQGEPSLFQWFGARPKWFVEPSCAVVMVPNQPRSRSWNLIPRAQWQLQPANEESLQRRAS